MKTKISVIGILLLAFFTCLYFAFFYQTEQIKTNESTIVIIDPNVLNYQQLLAGSSVNSIYILENTTDPFKQISSILENKKEVQTLHIISHGKKGTLLLGNKKLNSNNLGAYKSLLSAWKQSFVSNGSILLYGCNLAKDKEGKEFLSKLHDATNLNIASSIDNTGSEKLKGNWALEHQIGQIKGNLAIAPIVQPLYNNILTTGGPDNFGYTFIDSDETGGTVAFEDISGSGTNHGMGDESYQNITLGFDFDFYGNISNELTINSNGILIMGSHSTNSTYSNESFPNGTYTNFVAPLWDDLDPSAQGNVYSETKGSAPNRRYIVQWDDVVYWNSGTGNGVTFQIVLYEGSNNIDFVYQDTDFGNATYDDGNSATIGINKDGTDALQYSYLTNSLNGISSIRYTYPLPAATNTWYSYQTGDWSDPDSWTLDGSVNPIYNNPGSAVPGSSDDVVITNGRKISIQSGNDNLTVQSIEVIGELDITTSTGHDFTTISGSGTIYVSGNNNDDNFPAGTTTLFADPVVGGTVQLEGTGFRWNNANTFNNVIIDMDNNNDNITIRRNYNINGDLTITQGRLRFNSNSGNTKYTIDIEGNVLVSASGSIIVGRGNTIGSYNIGASEGASTLPTTGNYFTDLYHMMYVGGDFTNNGTVELTNQSVPDYNDFTNDGAVNLFFDNAQDNTFTINGTTKLYNLIVDKGTDQTYILELTSNSTSNLTLFGPNVLVHQPNIGNTASVGEYTVQNPEVRKPIYIKHGTLKLTGDITIPTLAESSGFNFDYYADMVIPQDGRLWIAGNNVTVRSTALSTDAEVVGHDGVDDNIWGQGFTVLGKFEISAGILDTQNSWEGLIFYPNTIAPEIQIDGGTVTTGWLRDQFGSGKASYTQTGGTVNITGGPSGNNPNTARFGITSSDMTFNMSGGSIVLGEYGVPIDFTVNCSEGNYSVTGGKVVFDMDVAGNTITTPNSNLWDIEINSTSGSQTLTFATDVVAANDFTIHANSTVDVDNTNNYNLSVGADFTIDASGSYLYRSNTTTLNENKLTNLNFGSQQEFNNLTISKSDPTKDVFIFNGAATAIVVNGNFRLESGNFDYDTYTVEAKSSIHIADTIKGNSGTGKFLLNGSALQTATSENGMIQNLEIDNSNGIDLQTGDLSVNNTLTLTNGILDINENKLTLAGATASIAGSGFGAAKMIMTSGNASDGGLELYLDAVETLTYPIGTDANSDTRYTPAVGSFSSFTDDGYIRISPADDVLPTTNGNGGTMLSYYWRIKHQGFTTLPQLNNWTFEGSENDDGTGSGSSFPASWRAGKVLNEIPFTRSYVSSNSSVDDHTIINDNDGTTFDLDNADYSAGPPNRFNGTPDIYYSRQDGNFNTASTWSKNDDTGSGTQEVPSEGSIVIIQSDKDGSRGHRVNVYNSIDDLGAVQFEHDYTNLPTPNSETVPRFQFHIAGTFETGVVEGTGMVSFDASVSPTVNGDFGDFGNNLESYFLYFGGNATVSTVPSPIPNLVFERYDYSLNQNVTVQGDFIIQGDGSIEPQQDVQINQDLVVGFWIGGDFVFPGSGSNLTVTVDGNIDFTQDPYSNPSDRDLYVEDPGSNTGLEHSLILKGNVLHGSDNGYLIDFYNGTTRPWVNLELQGASDNFYSRTSTSEPDLYSLVVNKGTDQSNSFEFQESFTLSASTNGTTKALTLENGTLILNDPGIDIDLTTGGDDFSIPNTSALEITQGTCRVYNNGNGIALDGAIIINGGRLDMDDETGDENYIEYSSTGSASINISSGSMQIGSQLRRNTVTTTGVLSYTQTGGTVEIGTGDGGEASRGMLEILNSGSNFTYTGGTLSIERQNTASPEIAAVYLDPNTSNVTGSTLYLGTANTPASQDDFRINSNIALNNVEIAGTNSPTVVLNIRPLTVSGNLVINSNATLDGSGLDLTVTGNMTNNGTYNANGNTSIFNASSAQTYSGSGTSNFYNLTKTAAGTLTNNNGYTISNDFHLEQGVYNTSSIAVNVNGNVVNDATHTNSSGNGIVLNGSSAQTISRTVAGSSTFATLTIDNLNGVSIPDASGYNFSVSRNLRLSEGVFNIGGNLLTIESNAVIEEVKTFGINNMIQTNSSFTDNGVKKDFNAIGSSTNFVFPVGESNYAPISFTITSTDAGSMTVRPANEIHPAIVEDSEAPDTEIVDADNALQYHWILTASGLTNFNGSATFNYNADDAVVTAPYTLANYIPARIFDVSANWDKAYNTADFDENNNQFTIPFSAASDATLSGEYTAGVGVDNSDIPINGAIPDVVPEYETNQAGGGNFDTGSSWNIAIPSGGPLGAIITVKAGDVLTLNNDEVRLFRTIIETGAVLEIDETTKHRLGTVSGAGTIKIVSNSSNANLPAGYYNNFFNCSGGELDYAGSGSYNVMSGITLIKDLTFSDGGVRNFSSNNITICNNLEIDGPISNNTQNIDITVNNDLLIPSGTFNSGSSNVITVVGDLNISGGAYEAGIGGNDVLNNLVLSSGSFNAGSGGSIGISGNITYSGGSFNGGSSTSQIILNGSGAQNLSGAFTTTAAFHNLEVNNSSGVNFGGDVDLENTLTLSDGLIAPGANTFKLGASATVSPSTGSATSYINGRLHKEMNIGSSFTFPIGKATRWGYAGVNNVSTGGLTWQAEYYPAAPTSDSEVDNLTPTDAVTIKTVSQGEFWRISDGQSPGSASASVSLRWDGSSDVSAIKAERETLTVMEWNDGASSWDNHGGQSFSSGHTQSSGSLTSSTVVTFSEKVLTLGSENAANPLPVELVYFNGLLQDEAVLLTWLTASEKDNDFFEVQRSEDGKTFESIGIVEGGGNSTEAIQYDFYDEYPLFGTSYYRLKQVDFDGKFEYSTPISINYTYDGPALAASVYPNPTSQDNINIQIVTANYSNKVAVKVMDGMGRSIFAQSFAPQSLVDGERIALPKSISKGIYYVTVKQLDSTEHIRIIIK